MKKTTYILIALIVLAMVASFALPPLTLREVNPDVTVLALTGKREITHPGAGRTLVVTTDRYWLTGCTADSINDMNGVKPSNDFAIRVVVREVEGLETTELVADKSWMDNMTVTCSNDTLHVKLDYHSIEAPGRNDRNVRHRVEWTPDNSTIFTLLVPSGSLVAVNSMVGVKFEEFENADLVLEPNCTYGRNEFVNSSFRTLSMR